MFSDSQNLKALQAICRLYITDNRPEISPGRMNEIIEMLLALQPNNKDALVAKARWHLSNQQPQQAKSILDTIIQKTGKSLIIEALLCDSYEQLCSWDDVEAICRSILASNELKDDERPYWMLKLTKSLLRQRTGEKINEAASILASDSLHGNLPMFQLLRTLLSLQLDNTEVLSDDIEQLESLTTDKQEIVLLKVEYLLKKKEVDEAVVLVDSLHRELQSSPYFNLECAKLLWSLQSTRPKSIPLFLNVIKINREIVEPYIYLGTLYGEQKESEASLQRAARCLEKAFQLQPKNQDVARKLFDSYIALSDNNNAQKLLDVIIKSNQKGCRWAWLKKGYLHLKKFRQETLVIEKEKEAGRAVTCFQNALDMDLNDSSTYENLGNVPLCLMSFA